MNEINIDAPRYKSIRRKLRDKWRPARDAALKNFHKIAAELRQSIFDHSRAPWLVAESEAGFKTIETLWELDLLRHGICYGVTHTIAPLSKIAQ